MKYRLLVSRSVFSETYVFNTYNWYFEAFIMAFYLTILNPHCEVTLQFKKT